MVRYTKCGGEACAIAVRIARSATGRDKILFADTTAGDWYGSNQADANLNAHCSRHRSTGVPEALAGTSLPFLQRSRCARRG